ncbi:shikimate dehydrogenase family protein [Brevundimonas subvibrioides]|uniref:Shikimate dehydrogenase (NADP(+)) n=1 Tax=Brevundimonas subvibrioides (strain ATCC 15264 / DSM 4735 / LMG 14903 / NBRC 16000 / CB 81) TaxID=633149 RepID=D9QJS2_BRESC|nr:shikimate dehydrogenase [Brevundimonas subvibrioides]ADK99673.1 Shikimate dehydrogenase substrate binding domain protein [Brevundimonas subvibrioides ATCC 15264]
MSPRSVTGSRLTGAARVGGIVGNPVAHSLSPVIHNAWLDAAGLDATYAAFAPRDPAGFDALVAFGRAGLLAGVNVTAPFKEQAFASADTVSETARAGGSANILVFRAGQVLADSSDGEGLLRALAQQAPGLSLRGSIVVMLGAGGAARAAVAALSGAGATVRIVNRTRERAEALAADLGGSVEVGDTATAFTGAALVVNALSVRPELDPATLDPATVVMDMTYRPVRTAFLQAAQAAGLTTVDGLAMLIGQAGPSFRAIFGVEPPDLDLRPLLLAHLGETA